MMAFAFLLSGHQVNYVGCKEQKFPQVRNVSQSIAEVLALVFQDLNVPLSAPEFGFRQVYSFNKGVNLLLCVDFSQEFFWQMCYARRCSDWQKFTEQVLYHP